MKKINNISVLDTSICTQNIGDEIIMEAVYDELYDIFKDEMFFKIPTHEIIGKSSLSLIRNSQFGIVGGSNILSSSMNKYKQWRIYLTQSFFINNKIILLGVGWRNYQNKPNFFTKKILKTLLNQNFLHSVRDYYTESQLKKVGLSNVINTGCPTIWKLTDKHCSQIKENKSNLVVFTLTDYSKAFIEDKFFIELLLNSYENVFYWTQSSKDLVYLHELDIERINEISIIPPSLRAFNQFLETHDCDYVGTRLHGGIKALQRKKRTIIIGIDNRAIEKKKDFNLKVIERMNMKSELENMIKSDFKTEIKLPIENINIWKSQFKSLEQL